VVGRTVLDAVTECVYATRSVMVSGGEIGEKETMEAFRRIQSAKTGNVIMVAFKDKKILDDTVLDEIKKEIATLLGKAAGPDVLLDFGNVEFMSSAMLGLLGQLHRKIATGHGRLKMCSIRPEIFQVFKLTNLDKLFSIHKDAPTALATFT
jgi:anti-sigma B factor antagonist